MEISRFVIKLTQTPLSEWKWTNVRIVLPNYTDHIYFVQNYIGFGPINSEDALQNSPSLPHHFRLT